MLGYGDSSKPTSTHAYDNTILSSHIIEILDHEGLDKVIGVGHDWGALMMSTTIRMYPGRFERLVFLATGYLTSQAIFVDIERFDRRMVKAIGRPLLGYWHFHNEPDAAEVMERADPASFATLLYSPDPQLWIEHVCPRGKLRPWIESNRTTAPGPWLSDTMFNTHTQIMTKGGYTGPFNWYKQAMAGITHRSELALNPDYAKTKFDIPTLFVGCENDAVNLPELQVRGMERAFSDLTTRAVPAGHWVMLERPSEMWDIVHTWIERKGGVAKL